MHPTHPQEKSVFKCYHVQIIWIFKSLELSFKNNKTGKGLWIGLQETEGAKLRLEKAPIFLFSITINPILQKNHTMLYTEKFRNSWVNQDIVQFPIILTRRTRVPATDRPTGVFTLMALLLPWLRTAFSPLFCSKTTFQLNYV